jgi:hypothetical protein
MGMPSDGGGAFMQAKLRTFTPATMQDNWFEDRAQAEHYKQHPLDASTTVRSPWVQGSWLVITWA